MTLPLGPMRQAVVVGGSQRHYDPPGAIDTATSSTVASVTVSPLAFSVIEGLDVQDLTVTPKNNTGGIVSGKTAVWSTSDSAVVTVVSTGNLSGRVTAIATGTATITATVDGIAGTSAATVLAAVATVTLSSTAFTVGVAAQRAISALVLDSGGNPLVGRNINWVSDDTGIATVTAGAGYAATVLGVATGTATITATVGGVSGVGTATVTSVAALPLIMTADFGLPNSASDWTITGSTYPFADGGGVPPVSPHSIGAGNGEYSLTFPTNQFGGGPFWSFSNGQFYPAVQWDFEFNLNAAISRNCKGLRAQSGNGTFPSGTGLGGLYWDSSSASAGIHFVFEPPGSLALNIDSLAHYGSGGVVSNLADGVWHTCKYTYDVGKVNFRMKLEIDGTPVTQPDGTSVLVFGLFENCAGQFGTSAATWQGGWVQLCGTNTPTVIGGGLFNDTAHAGSAGPVLRLRNLAWRDATGLA